MVRLLRVVLRPLAASVPALLCGALLCLFSHRASAQVNYRAQIALASEACNGTVSLTTVCNTTAFSYSAGCPSAVPKFECEHPTRGHTCTELPDYNATCLTEITCDDFKFPANSHGNNLWPSYGEALEIECDYGYERSDTKGFVTKAYCLDSGNFTEMDDPGFTCVRLSCGQYCRYCEGTATRFTNDPRVVMQYRDEFGEPCCLVRPDPLFDNEGRNDPFVANGVVQRPWIRRFGESIAINCNPGYDAVPAYGLSNPQCIPRTDCAWNAPADPAASGWNVECVHVRGMYERGAVCKRVLPNVTFTYASSPSVPCEAGAIDCEFPERVQISLQTDDPAVTIYWSFEDEITPGVDLPVSEPTGRIVSVAAAGGSEWTGAPISIASSKSGCNVVTQFRTINAVATKDGRPNSVVSVSPLIKVTATNGRMPANMSKCEGNPPVPEVNGQGQWLRPSQLFQGCRAYRFYAFVPVALADTQADAMALSELTFWFKGRVVEGGVASTAGVCPAAESPRYLTDRDPNSKMLTLTNCWVMVDFDRAVAVDSFEVGTSNDCTSRDPVRWMILASPDATRWVLIDDQTRTSFPMPLVRNTFAAIQTLEPLLPQVAVGTMKNITILDSTKVGNARNRVLLTISVLDAQKRVVAPPLGTRFVLAGLSSRLVSATDDFHIDSKFLGPPEHEAPGIQPKGRWFRGNDGLWKVEFVVGQCLPAEPFSLSFVLINPPITDATQAAPRRTLYVEGLDSMAIANQAFFQMDVMRGGERVRVVRMEALEATKVQGTFNTISVKFLFTAPPMTGTEIVVDKLLGSMSGSDPELPVTWERQDGSQVQAVGNYDAEMGRLTTTMPVDSVQSCKQDGTCLTGNEVTIIFQIYNPVNLQEPYTLEAFVNFCPLPAQYGCQRSQLQTVGPAVSDGDVLGGVEACLPIERLDNCSVCDGDDSLCKGCDGVVNSGREIDQCGVCGGSDACIGCDGVVNSGLALDRCGVCNGTNACENIVEETQVVDWPHIALNLTIINAPGRAAITDAEVFSIKKSVADSIDFVWAAVDVLTISDAPAAKALVSIRRHLHPEHLTILAKRGPLPGEAVCTIQRAEKFGCAVNQELEETWVAAHRLRGGGGGGGAAMASAAERGEAADMAPLHRRLLQTGGDPPPTGVIDVWLRLNFNTDAETLEKAVALEEVILNGELAQQLTRNELCNASGMPCRALIFENIAVRLEKPLVLDDPPPPPKKDDLVTVITIVCCVVGVLVLCGCALLVRWRGIVKERKAQVGYKLSDLMDAAGRGTTENVKNAPPSDFVPPKQFQIMTQQDVLAQQSPMGGKANLKQAAGSFKKNRRRWLTGGLSGSQESLEPPSSPGRVAFHQSDVGRGVGGGGSPVAVSFQDSNAGSTLRALRWRESQNMQGSTHSAEGSAHSGERTGAPGQNTQRSFNSSEGWDPQREEPGATTFGRSVRVKKKVLTGRDREALFAQAFPDAAAQEGVEVPDGDIFEMPVEDAQLSPGRQISPGRGVPWQPGSAEASVEGSKEHGSHLGSNGNHAQDNLSEENGSVSRNGSKKNSLLSGFNGFGKSNGKHNGNGNGNGHGNGNGNGYGHNDDDNGHFEEDVAL